MSRVFEVWERMFWVAQARWEEVVFVAWRVKVVVVVEVDVDVLVSV